MRPALPWRAASTPRLELARYEQPSLALEHVVARLRHAPRCGVLDLGSPTAANLELYSRHGAKITFADLHRFYAPKRAEGSSSEHFNAFLPKTPSQIDVVLAWDLFDYLSLEEIAWLRQSLAGHCAPGAILYALVSSQGLIPDTPSFFAIADDKTLRVEEAGPRVRPSPALSEHTLVGSLHELTVQSRFQLRRAAVEYLFSWR
jgi:hypothetical protein